MPLSTDVDQRSYERELARVDACAVGGGETFSGVLEYNHNPFTPYRRAAFSEHIEDFDGLTVAIPSYPQVGIEQPGGAQGDVLDWLDFLTGVYANTPDADGSPSVAWTTDESLITTFEAWEADHPGQSSFDFDVEAHQAGDPQPYPYPLEALARALVGADFGEELNLGPSIVAWRLEHRELWVDGYDRFDNPNLVLDDSGADLILAPRRWSSPRPPRVSSRSRYGSIRGLSGPIGRPRRYHPISISSQPPSR